MKLPAGQQIIFYLGVTLTLSLAVQLFIINRVGTAFSAWTILLMWVPGFCAIGASYLWGPAKNPLRPVLALWRPHPKYFAIAYAIPAAAAILILAVSCAAGLGEFHFAGDRTTFNRLFFAPTFGVLIALIGTVGAELGWRGFLHTRLKEIRFPHPYLLTGVVCAIWYWPLIIFTNYAAARVPWIGLVVFTLMIISFSYFLGQLREASRSVWPCAMAFAVHNTWIHVIYPHFLKAGAIDPFFGGETGVILAIIYLSLAIYLDRQPIE